MPQDKAEAQAALGSELAAFCDDASTTVLPRTEDGIRSCRFIPVYQHAADADRPADPAKPQHHPKGPVDVYLLDCRRGDGVARLAFLLRTSIALAKRGLPGEWGLYPACAVRKGDYVGAYLGRVLFINPKVQAHAVGPYTPLSQKLN